MQIAKYRLRARNFSLLGDQGEGLHFCCLFCLCPPPSVRPYSCVLPLSPEIEALFHDQAMLLSTRLDSTPQGVCWVWTAHRHLCFEPPVSPEGSGGSSGPPLSHWKGEAGVNSCLLHCGLSRAVIGHAGLGLDNVTFTRLLWFLGDGCEEIECANQIRGALSKVISNQSQLVTLWG